MKEKVPVEIAGKWQTVRFSFSSIKEFGFHMPYAFYLLRARKN